MGALKVAACIAAVAVAIGGLVWAYVDTNDERWDR